MVNNRRLQFGGFCMSHAGVFLAGLQEGTVVY